MFRILTEDKDRAIIFIILAQEGVQGYTVTECFGAWNGTQEKTLAIDLVHVPESKVRRIAERIRNANGQESVLVVNFSAESTFI